jgi:hypothetical protein
MVQQATYNTLILGALLAGNCLPKMLSPSPVQKFALLPLLKQDIPDRHPSSIVACFVPEAIVEAQVLDDGSLPNVANLQDSKETHQG